MQLHKTSAWQNLFIFKAPLLCANHFFLINHTRILFWYSNLNKPQTKNFVLTLLSMEGETGGGGGWFNNFFFTQVKNLKFSDFMFLSFRHNVAKFH